MTSEEMREQVLWLILRELQRDGIIGQHISSMEEYQAELPEIRARSDSYELDRLAVVDWYLSLREAP